MGRRADHPRNVIKELFDGRPGWRLEPRATPGAPPAWCYVDRGEIEFSVTAERDVIHLYVMATDKVVDFKDADQLTTWLQANKSDALQAVPVRPDAKSRFRSLLQWG